MTKKVCHECCALRRGKVSACQPRERVDNVGGHERVLEVEHGELAIRGQRIGPSPILSIRHDRLAWRCPDTSVLDDGGQVHVVDVVIPIDDAGVEGEDRLLVVAEGGKEPECAIDAISSLGLGVGAIELDIAEGALCGG